MVEISRGGGLTMANSADIVLHSDHMNACTCTRSDAPSQPFFRTGET